MSALLMFACRLQNIFDGIMHAGMAEPHWRGMRSLAGAAGVNHFANPCFSQAAEHAKEVKRLNQLLQALELASTGDATALLADQDEDMPSASVSLASKGRQGLQGGGTKVSLAEIKQQLQRQLKQQVSL